MNPYLLSLLLFFPVVLTGQSSEIQPSSGPGGADYAHGAVKQYDFAQQADGYWLYEPADPVPQSSPVVVFVHGYGAYNPMIYGQWIKHLVRKGNIVIFPRYQKNLTNPKTKFFVENASKAIRDALSRIRTGAYVKPTEEGFALIGHSYGGVISANLGVNFAENGIPQPEAILLCSPGTGPFKGGLLESYDKMPPEIKLLVMVSEDDRVVGDEIGKLVYSTTKKLVNKNYIIQRSDYSAKPYISAGHNESYALDQAFDSGVRNYSAKKALRAGKTDQVDYFGYWKLFDALLDCSRNGQNCHVAFGNTPEQRFLGIRENGEAIVELEIITLEKWITKKDE